MRVAMLIPAVLAVISVCDAAQQTKAVRPSVSQVRERMISEKWKERAVAFEDALRLLRSGGQNDSEADKLRCGLIELLAKENSLSRVRAKAFRQKTMVADDVAEVTGEEHSEYLAELISVVADLDDERAIPALLGAANTGGIAIQGVARFGTKALDVVLEQAKGSDADLAAGALFVVLDMLGLRTVTDPASLLRIKGAIRSALASPDARRRRVAVWAIEYLEDREEFVSALKEIAKNDPYRLPGQPMEDGTIGDLYSVRHTAGLVLQRILNHEPLPVTPPIKR